MASVDVVEAAAPVGAPAGGGTPGAGECPGALGAAGSAIPPTAELVGRLLERQRAADRAAARRGWLARALGRAAC